MLGDPGIRYWPLPEGTGVLFTEPAVVTLLGPVEGPLRWR